MQIIIEVDDTDSAKEVLNVFMAGVIRVNAEEYPGTFEMLCGVKRQIEAQII